MQLNIILLEPEIPPNTGNIARTCAALGAKLHLIEPLGFSIDDATVKRAGLDYWDKVAVTTYKDIHDFSTRAVPLDKVWFLSTKGQKMYTELPHEENIWIMFGKETRGIPEDILAANYPRCIRIPMRPDIRSLNLSNAVALCAYEIYRQHGFPGLEDRGALTSVVKEGF